MDLVYFDPEFYRFENLIFYESSPYNMSNETNSNDFFIGREVSKTYIGNLFLGVRFDHIQLVLDNIDYIKFFLTEKSIQEAVTSSITTFEDLVNFIQSYNQSRKRFKIFLSSRFSIALKQFLSYFTEFVEKAKGQKIRLDILSRENTK